MNPVLFRAMICAGGALLAAATALFWTIILVPTLDPLPRFAVASVVAFAGGVLLTTFAPLMHRALGATGQNPSGRARGPWLNQSGDRHSGLAKVLVCAILLEYVAISLLR
jgi:hypothetical protein